MKAHRQHGHSKRTPAPPQGRVGARPKRAATGSPTGAIVRPTPASKGPTARPTRRHRNPDAAAPDSPAPRRRNRYGDNGVASLGEARAHQKLRRASRDEARRGAPKPPKQRDRRNIKTTKPLLATRFGAGRPRRRLIATLMCLLVVIGAVLVKVGMLQGGQGGAAMRASALELWTRTRNLPAQRGAIFDRNGDELALSVPAAYVAVNPQQIEDVPGTVEMLARLLQMSPEKSAELTAAIESSDAGFMYVDRQIDPAIADQIDELGLLGVSTTPEDRRIMPGGVTGQSVIGRTDIDGNGIAGLELQYGANLSDPDNADMDGLDDILRGSPGEMTLEVAPGGRTIAGSEHVTTPAIAGVDLITTLDRSVQYSVEQALLRQVQLTESQGGQVIVMDTDTGDVIAMATVVRRDGVPVISSGNWSAVGAYEPGSVGKIMTMAAALNEGEVDPSRSWYVPWQHDCTDNPNDGILSDSHQHEPMSMSARDILVESSNVGTIYVAQTIGYERLYDYMRLFGMAEPTALGFPGESAGLLKPWQEWEGTERCTMSYGHGYAATPIQMTAAVNAIANDGVYVAPRLVLGTVGGDGEITDAEPSATHPVVTEQTATQVQSMLREAVCDPRGTGNQAQVAGLSVAGKTGTSYKVLDNGTYRDEEGKSKYYVSFAGFFPAEDPQVTVLVSIDEPPKNTSGGQTAAPLFREIVPTIIQELGIVPPPGSTDCDGNS